MSESTTVMTSTRRLQEEGGTSSGSASVSFVQYYLQQQQDYNTYNNNNNASSSRVIGEIEEEEEETCSSDLFEINHGVPLETIHEIELDQGSLFSFDVNGGGGGGCGGDCVYVGVGKSESSSMDALSWTLKNVVVAESTTLYLIHIFPEVHYIPSPLGRLPRSQVSPVQVENYMAQESSKRAQFLQKFMNKCTTYKVKVDTILIESDMVAKAILDLIPILNMKKLVLGTSRSGIRKSWSSRRGGGIADQVLEDAPEYCEVKIICDGKEVTDHTIGSLSLRASDNSPKPLKLEDQSNHNNPDENNIDDSFACMCFKSPKVN